MYLKKFTIILVYLFFFAHQVISQTGKCFTHNYTPADYGAADQNWATTQDNEGRIFVANLDGVLMNDGLSWQKIEIRNKSIVTSIAKSISNIIYVGGGNEFGYLAKTKTGKFKYQSLSAQLVKTDSEFGNIWAIKCIGDDVFFCTNDKIFTLKNDKLSVLLPENDKTFHTFFTVDSHLFVREKNTGIKIFLNNTLTFLPASEIFKDPNNRIDCILPADDTTYWVGSSKLGMYKLHYNNKNPLQTTFTKYQSPIEDWIVKKQLYCAEKVNDNLFAFGSLLDGVVLTDKNLHPIKKINSNNGLQEDAVKHIYSDFNGNIWLSLNLGLSFVEINTPITHWTKQDGIKGTLESVIKFKGSIYIANDKGVQILDTLTNRFITTPISSSTWDLIEFNHTLFAATDDGFISFANNKIKLLYDEGPYLIYKYPNDNNTFFLGLDNSLVIGTYENEVFKVLKRYEDWSRVKWAASEENGNIAFGTSDNGVYIINPKNLNIIKHLDISNGLPSMTENNVFDYNKKLYIGTDKGIYKIKGDNSWQCVKAEEFSSADINRPITRAKQIGNDIWVQVTRNDNSQLKRNELSTFIPKQKLFIENQKILKRIKGIDVKDFYMSNNIAYIATNDGLYCYDISDSPNQKEFNTFASYFLNKDDTLSENITPSDTSKIFNISFNKNEISVVPSAADYFDKNEIAFSWYLEGQDNTYNAWQKTNLIFYNNLHEGSYVLHIKSMNILGQQGEPIHISFSVSTPWYRSVIAFILYVIGGILLIWVIVEINSKRLKSANMLLEKTIEERTSVIVEQKKLVEEKHKEITDSINYAERIQRSFLASDDLLRENLKEYFVYFQPKDVVSGDFYWASKLNNSQFSLVTADSTGHGVPGAIMSILNIACLNEAIKEGYENPADILNHTRTKIIEVLKRDGSAEGGKDGMDCSLISFDFKNNKLTYSAANNPIWIIRENQLLEFASDKMPVGKHDKDFVPFTQHTIDLQKGDVVYALTDGMPDQFGGPKGKKFMYKQLKALLISISSLSMREQKDNLSNALNAWKGNLEQVDDICVIGIRI